MGKPAARLTDMHMCPMVTPGVPPIPHVGGPITGPGCPTVLIGGLPAAVMGDMCVCVGPPDTLVLGSTGVFIGGKPAVRMGDTCAHGGTVMLGCMTVLIGETSPGGPGSVVTIPPVVIEINPIMATGMALKNAAVSGDTYVATPSMPPPPAKDPPVRIAKSTLAFTLLDEDGKPMADINYEVTLPHGEGKRKGKTDKDGKVMLTGIDAGTCKVSFPDLDASEWG